MDTILFLQKPDRPLPLIFDSPHSGTIYPEDFDFSCDFKTLERAEDKYVDDLFSAAPDYGATLLCALFPRSYIDVNRAACDIDPNLLLEEWSHSAINPTARSDVGIGLVRRLVRPGVPVYSRHLSQDEILRRIENYYEPYHDALKNLLDEAHYNFGQVWHINCHSMPSASALPKRPSTMHGHTPKPSDFVIGNRDGTSCAFDFTHALRDFIKGRGYTVTVNDPFKGVEIVRRYANPARGRHSIQLEINKSLYMNEHTQQKNSNYDALKSDITALIKFSADYTSAQLTDLAAD